MFAGIGIAIVLVTVIGGYMMEHGNLSLLIQPAEIVIIFGAAIGGFVIGSPPKVIKATLASIGRLFSGKSYTQENYVEVLLLLSEIFYTIRRGGLLAIEGDIDDPHKSEIFKKYPNFLNNHHALVFLTDTLRSLTIMELDAHELASLLEYEIEAHHEELLIPSKSIANVADALPGLGIVAAVLGVVITMGKISEPPEVLGHCIGAALVGTFMGVLMCYGFVGPMARNLEHMASEDQGFLNVIKVALVAFVSNPTPQMAVEFGRRVVPNDLKPSFLELEKLLRQVKKQ